MRTWLSHTDGRWEQIRQHLRHAGDANAQLTILQAEDEIDEQFGDVNIRYLSVTNLRLRINLVRFTVHFILHPACHFKLKSLRMAVTAEVWLRQLCTTTKAVLLLGTGKAHTKFVWLIE
jgi:hypothetical protein